MFRYFVLLLAFPAVVALERFANYLVRSQLVLFMRDPVADGGLAMTMEQVGSTHGMFSVLTGVAPLLGGLIAIAPGPRIAMVAGGLVGIVAYVALAAASAATLMLSLVLWAIGYGLLLPSLYAVVAREVSDQDDANRMAPFFLVYAAVNVGALIAPPLTGVLRNASASPAIITGAAAVVMTIVTAVVTVVALLGTKRQPTSSGGRVELGLLLVLALLLAPMTVMALGFDALFAAPPSAVFAEVLFAINPTIVILLCLAATVAMLVLGALKKKPPILILLGIGAVLIALGSLPLLLGATPPSLTVQIAAVSIMALGEPLVLAAGAARMATGTHPRFAALVLGAWFCASRGVFALGHVVSGAGWTTPLLIVTAVGCLISAVLLFVFSGPLQRLCFEPPAPTAPGKPDRLAPQPDGSAS